MVEANLERTAALIERILEVTKSPQSLPFYRNAIRVLGEGIVEEEFGELRYRLRLGSVDSPANYFTSLLQKHLSTKVNAAMPGIKSESCPSVANTKKQLERNDPHAFLDSQTFSRQCNGGRSAKDLFAELKPISRKAMQAGESGAMNLPYSSKVIQWATFIGPEFFTLSTNKARSDRVTAKFRIADGRLLEVPLIRGRMFPKDEERGILTTEEGRILGAMECLWVEQGCQYVQFEKGAVSCHCQVPIRRLAELLGWESFGGRDLEFLKRKAVNLKMKAYYLQLEAAEELRDAGFKGYGFTLLDGIDVIEKAHHGSDQTTLRVSFSDPYSRQLLARRVVSRPKELLRMRSELAFVLRLYLEPILIGRGREHSIELQSLIKTLNLPSAGWHSYKSRRKAIFGKAIQELNSMKTYDGRYFSLDIRQGSNPRDFVMSGCLETQDRLLT